MEEKNLKIVSELETKNDYINNTNLQLKDRITKFNKSEWNNKFSENLQDNLQNLQNVHNQSLNITDTIKFNNMLQNEVKFNCFKCDKNFKTLNLMMNHRKITHRVRTKCRNMQNCNYNEKCWYSHNNEDNDDDNESIKTYYTN